MKKLLIVCTAFSAIAPAAFAARVTPYVGLGIVADKAGTSAKRVGFNPDNISVDMSMINNIPGMIGNALGSAVVRDGGGNMKFDMAFAGEITAGVKYGNFRAELEAAFRSASEDKYNIYNGSFQVMRIVNVDADLKTSTSVRHNSYLANFYYDFTIDGSNWEPYVGAGLGIGTYKQKATVDATGLATMGNNKIPFNQSMTALEDIKTEFEWQIALGTAYNFTDDWAVDVGYRFNSSTISGEFVYAHEIKVGARYAF